MCQREKKRKTTIISLEAGNTLIEGESNILDHATVYFKSLFGPEITHDVYVTPDLWDGCKKVSDDENRKLCRPFSETEIKEALF